MKAFVPTDFSWSAQYTNTCRWKLASGQVLGRVGGTGEDSSAVRGWGTGSADLWGQPVLFGQNRVLSSSFA